MGDDDVINHVHNGGSELCMTGNYSRVRHDRCGPYVCQIVSKWYLNGVHDDDVMISFQNIMASRAICTEIYSAKKVTQNDFN